MEKLKQIHQNAAGIDVGSERFFIAFPDSIVQNFLTFTSGIVLAIAALKKHGVTSVAMESTGVYGVVLYEMLQESGTLKCLANRQSLIHA